MAMPRSRLLDFIVYVAVRAAVCLFQALTDRAAVGVGRGLGWLVYVLDRRHRRVADDNLRHAFPHLDGPRRDRLVRTVFRHFATLLIDLARLPRKLHRSNAADHGDMSACRELFAAIAGGRGTLLVSGHLGNWECAGYGLGLLGHRTHAVARPLDNPYLDRLLRRFRENTGQRVLNKNGDAMLMAQILTGGGTLATLADQDAGPGGLFVEFFGRPASVHKGIAVMALKFDAQIFVAGLVKTGEPLRYRLEVEEVIDPRDYAGQLNAIKAITQRYTAALERLIRRHPEQYFWLHRRWKSRPAARTTRAA
ncbi:MAG: lysophospholipid acyltransferase family protein [Gemmataceae bacterium]